ncbi:MAG TPA: hypothetical protein PLY16_02405 [Candidatus Saccharibacteria bacterium]|nr:hypothetical protein [Candidatus Saccharibacteria bacterium]
MNQSFEGTNIELTTPSDILGLETQGAAPMEAEAGWGGEITQDRLDSFSDYAKSRLSEAALQDIVLEGL